MPQPPTRRRFLGQSLAAGAGLAFAAKLPGLRAAAPGNTLVLAVAGVNSRGRELGEQFAKLPGATVKYLIDVDRRCLGAAVTAVSRHQSTPPRTLTDFRRALEDKEVDALVVATPDHWHAPMSLLALQAGKHVYVEKPCSHNPREGELLIESAARHRRQVQMGTQRRSMPTVVEMTRKLREGLIGRVYLARCFYARRRAPIGFGKPVAPPAELDWDLWQGPAPRTAYRDNVHPYNWHWFWAWGTGEALNNGVHFLDVARWGMGVTFPTRVSSFGGRWHDVGVDDWEAPDTQEILLDYPDGRGIAWFGRSTNSFGPGHKANGVVFYGTGGIVDYDGDRSYTVYDLDNKVVGTFATPAAAAGGAPAPRDTHAPNFLAAIRGEQALTAPIDVGHCSTLLGHLGNIAHRVGRTLTTDPANGRILGDTEAAALWTRNYEPGWEPRV